MEEFHMIIKNNWYNYVMNIDNSEHSDFDELKKVKWNVSIETTDNNNPFVVIIGDINIDEHCVPFHSENDMRNWMNKSEIFLRYFLTRINTTLHNVTSEFTALPHVDDDDINEIKGYIEFII